MLNGVKKPYTVQAIENTANEWMNPKQKNPALAPLEKDLKDLQDKRFHSRSSCQYE